MSNSPGIKREFYFGQPGSSWCTYCNGNNCEEDIGFLSDEEGNVQGYIIDSEKLNEAASRIHPKENERLRDSSPLDGIYKRVLDVKKLISRNPGKTNTVRFSSDVLKHLLVGIQGCEDYVKGVRTVPCENQPERKGYINLNRKAAEVLSGKRRGEDVKLVKGSGEESYRNSSYNPLTRGY